MPAEEEAAPTFYVQTTDTIPASPPHPEGAFYVISFGLRETGAGLLPMAKIHMCLPGDDTEHPPFFPLGSKDHDKVTRAVQDLFDSKSVV